MSERMPPWEDDSRLTQPSDEVVDDPDTAWDPEADQRAEPETPAADEAEPEQRLAARDEGRHRREADN